MPVCEICKLSLTRGEGYVLVTRQAAASSYFWEQRFTNVVIAFKRKYQDGIPRVESDKKFKTALFTECGRKNGWLICSGCISEFPGIDREQARDNAVQFWESDAKEIFCPAGGGSIPIFEALEIASPIWKRMTGMDPPRIEPPPEKNKKKSFFSLVKDFFSDGLFK